MTGMIEKKHTFSYESKVIPWYRMLWLVASQDPDEVVDMDNTRTCLIARYINQYGGDVAGGDVTGAVRLGMVTYPDHNSKPDVIYNLCTALSGWRHTIRQKLVTFGEIHKSMVNFQLAKLER